MYRKCEKEIIHVFFFLKKRACVHVPYVCFLCAVSMTKKCIALCFFRGCCYLR